MVVNKQTAVVRYQRSRSFEGQTQQPKVRKLSRKRFSGTRKNQNTPVLNVVIVFLFFPSGNLRPQEKPSADKRSETTSGSKTPDMRLKKTNNENEKQQVFISTFNSINLYLRIKIEDSLLCSAHFCFCKIKKET